MQAIQPSELLDPLEDSTIPLLNDCELEDETARGEAEERTLNEFSQM